ncbi:MAG: LysM peptidoglycan-binding domain-containing protein [FCB group bacterium]|nr:LysM peptidoglycan-binding domain-containing protein [FCB group bacterium]
MQRHLSEFLSLALLCSVAWSQTALDTSVLAPLNPEDDSLELRKLPEPIFHLDEDEPEMTLPDLSQSTDRLPQLLRDVKVYLTDALIADTYQDTLEVVYILDRIFELLAEADQSGEKTPEEDDEFSRFETALVDVYTNRLQTLNSADVPVTADQLRSEVSDWVAPLEVELGDSKYTVVDDREGHIPLVRNARVDQFIEFFQTKRRPEFEIWLTRYMRYRETVRTILKEHDLPEELEFLALIESGMNPRAYSRASASGMWQFIYSTGKKYGLNRNWYVDERRDPVKATHAACEYIKDLYAEFDDWYLSLAAYNSGAGRVRRGIQLHNTRDFWQLRSLPRETRDYIPYFLAAALICRNPEQYGFTLPEVEPLAYDEVELEKSADLNVLAKCCGISVNKLRDLNPELRQSATPSEGIYFLKIPKGSTNSFLEAFNALPDDQRFAPQYIVHRVRRGESLWTISRKYHVSIHDVAAVNKIKNRHRIQIGQKLTIPIQDVRSLTKARPTSTGSGPPGMKKVVYTVRKGDTLGEIAENYHTRASSIRRWNGLRYRQYIYPGQKLILWVSSS